MKPRETKILLVDPHPMTRVGLRHTLQSSDGCRVCAEACSLEEAIAMVESVSPDLVVTELELGENSGRDLLGHVALYNQSNRGKTVATLVLSALASKWDVLSAIELGASGYLTKSATEEEVLTALREVLAGRNYLHPEVAHLVFEKVRSPVRDNRAVSLTARESQLLNLLGRGIPPQEIADALHLAPSTVKTHVRNLFRKFSVSTRTQLLLRAIQMELIEIK